MTSNNPEGALLGVIADEGKAKQAESAVTVMAGGNGAVKDTITGFLLAGVGNVDVRKKRNFLVVDSKTSVKTIETTFKELTARDDIAIVLISQPVANMIRHVIDNHRKAIPAVLEIPSKDSPYDPTQDSLLTRVKHIFGSN